MSDSLGVGTRVAKGACVQDDDLRDGVHAWYQCNGADGDHDWDLLRQGPNSSCKGTFPFGGGAGAAQSCTSATLGTTVPAGTCVQDSDGDHPWYRCAGKGPKDWSALPNGPDGSCSKTIPLGG